MPGVSDAATIGALATGVGLPFNVISSAGLPPRAELRALGVRRVSLGPRAASATMGYLRALARDLREADAFIPDMRAAMSYDELNALFARPTLLPPG